MTARGKRSFRNAKGVAVRAGYYPPKLREIVDPVTIARLDELFGVRRDAAGRIVRPEPKAARPPEPKRAPPNS